LYNATTMLSMNLSWPLTVKAGLKNTTCNFWDNLLYDVLA